MLRMKSYEPVALSLERVKSVNAVECRVAPYPPRIVYSPPREPMSAPVLYAPPVVSAVCHALYRHRCKDALRVMGDEVLDGISMPYMHLLYIGAESSAEPSAALSGYGVIA